jgi:putative inorganic carbon (HCO3(-)) transporter
MTQISGKELWETSLAGRLTTFAFSTWESSLVGRAFAKVGRFSGALLRGSIFGKVWESDWPAALDSERSLAGQLLHGLNQGAARMGRRLAPLVNGAWESSLLGRFTRWGHGKLAPYVQTSLLVQGFVGFPRDVVLAPSEAVPTGTKVRTTSPVVYVLGVVLGFIPLVPTTSPLPSPTVLLIVGVWGAALFWLALKVANGDFTWRASSAMLPLGILLLVAAASTVQSALPRASMLNLVIWISAVLLFWMIVNLVQTSRDAAVLLGPILVGASLMALWGVYQVFRPPLIEEAWVDPTQGPVIRVFASMGNPNYLAEYMSLFLPLGLALWLQHPKRRLELGFMLGLMALALFLTGSRGGWLALVISIGILVFMRAPRLTPFMLLGGLAMPLVLPTSVLMRIASAFSLADTSNLYRVNIWRGVSAMMEQFWALGAGLGAPAFAAVYLQFMLPEARAAHAHNLYVQLFAEMGILGLIALLWCLLAVLRRPYEEGIKKQSPFLLPAVFAALVALLFHGMVEYIWYNPKLLFAFWAVAGLGMGLALGRSREARHEA